MIICDFLFVITINVWTNSAPLRDKRLQNLSVLNFELQGQSLSYLMIQLVSPYTTSEKCLTAATCLSLTT